MKVTATGKDHFGKGRTTSEDVIRLFEDISLYVVCDGSSNEDGKWAAETIAEGVHQAVLKERAIVDAYNREPTVERRVQVEDLLHRAVQDMNALIYRTSVIEKKRQITVTSMDAVLILNDSAVSVHVGNTRLYLIDDRGVHQLTRDHSLYEELGGREKKVNPQFKKRLTRALGSQDSVVAVPTSFSLALGNRLVLCSDGVSDHLDSDGMDLLALSRQIPLVELPNKLVEHVLKKGANDNISIVTIEATPDNTRELRSPAPAKNVGGQVDLLRQLPVFRGVHDSEAALRKIHARLRYRTFKGGEVLCKEGDASNQLYIVINGSAEVSLDGKRVASIQSREVVGEMGFFNEELRSADVVAAEPIEALVLDRKDYLELVRTDPALGYAVLQGIVFALSHKIRSGSARIAELTQALTSVG